MAPAWPAVAAKPSAVVRFIMALAVVPTAVAPITDVSRPSVPTVPVYAPGPTATLLKPLADANCPTTRLASVLGMAVILAFTSAKLPMATDPASPATEFGPTATELAACAVAWVPSAVALEAKVADR